MYIANPCVSCNLNISIFILSWMTEIENFDNKFVEEKQFTNVILDSMDKWETPPSVTVFFILLMFKYEKREGFAKYIKGLVF